ncbi:MAG: Lrp/AsnC family transcriptional regulator, regulator for asnA, asnC and gidA [Solirubrobacteraceae bacterium]|jgi:Lrp/AsnC family transcriptional regulator for asnA, asnC and gidA|nr:Lrp/AsnC family transcriptional regulator, regulator for asnA, asnC and gidA [Solirubrobacteraceae bacterium]MEA2318534.1 Lrp/AsnC family transcriptional regulator, regulator for asnA, asnC and gidA [Solirubrobacteraceae bacterium]
MGPDETLDTVDRAILRELQEDGRRPFREIARKIGVSERTVRARARRMGDDGVLRIIAFADPVRLGHSVLALVLIRVDTSGHDRVVETVASWPEVSYVSSLVGRADLYIQVMCRDNDELWRLVTQRLRALDGVIETETMLEVKVHKFVYSHPELGG